MTASAAVNVSPSLLADVLTCETKGWTRHVKGYTSQGESIKAVAGQGFHAGIAEFFHPAQAAVDNNAQGRALRAFHALYDPAFAACSADRLPDAAYTPANLHRVLARWLEMHPPSVLPWRSVVSVETAFVSREWQIGETTVRLIVRPDLIVEDADGRVRWVDTKTTGWHIGDPGWKKALRLSMQAALYTDAVVQRYGDRAWLGGWFSAIEMRTLPSDPTRKCQTHKLPYAECGNEHAKFEFIEAPQTPERITRALADARGGAARFVEMLGGETDVATLDMRGTAKGECRFCPASDWCEAQRVPEALPSFMHYEPWVVEEGVRA